MHQDRQTGCVGIQRVSGQGAFVSRSTWIMAVSCMAYMGCMIDF